MSKSPAQRAAKRRARENRAIKGIKKPIPHCERCGHKLSRFGCTYCDPSILAAADEKLGYGSPEFALLAALALRGGHR